MDIYIYKYINKCRNLNTEITKNLETGTKKQN